CVAASLVLSASGGSPGEYRWYTVATGGTALPGEVNDTYVTPVIVVTTIFHVALNNGSCESSRTPVTASINSVAKPALTTSNCTAIGAVLSGPAGFASYTWSDSETTPSINIVAAGTYTLVVTSSSGCSSPPSDPVTFTSAFCNQPPVLQATTATTTIQGIVTIDLSSLATDLDNNLDISTLAVVVQPSSGATATINSNHELIVDYSNVSFAGIDELTVQVCDIAGACVQQVITIEVAGDITVFNAVSPNGDGKNDVFFIEYINDLPETKQNKVTILNRWGSVVFETTNYDNTTNVFRGLSDNGSELPSGTYYYILQFTSGASKRTGFISLRR
ncbi:MAG: gliding motility-associated C-terminal domain-containing protein, partial [Cyclobacteriaceae bacterium]|nr:gliding motility-associated C-terminal domain-containing protein [Cyclobacteriaceae bacterium]